jgi:hypothetical protein
MRTIHAEATILVFASWAWAGGLHAADVILNEYNAVGGNRFLEDDGEDTYWGRVEGNGGDWFELVVITDHLDMRGWQLAMTDSSGGADVVLVLTDHALWSDLRSGTIITVAEELGDDADLYSPTEGRWWINVQAADDADGTYITAANFRVNNEDWRLTIRDASGNAVFGPAGEGVNPLSGVGNQEVCKLEQDPGASITPLSNYNDGQTSTMGAPNQWAGGADVQDFSGLRSGIVQCGEDGECDDGAFCNGIETCVGGRCRAGATPCPGRRCDEGRDTCVDCLVDTDCDDQDLCTADTCVGGTCQVSAIPGCDPDSVADADGDGIADDGDECTQTPTGEPVDGRGCACSQVDEDEDGVDDCRDECPDTPAGDSADSDGCGCSQLDEDEDGVDDCDDRCPDTTVGDPVDPDGCACLQRDPEGDDDADGVLNCLDRCEETGTGDVVDADGCSCLQLDPDGDDDEDGVLNCLDDCPATAGGDEVDESGCAVLTPGDGPGGHDNESPDEASPERSTGAAGSVARSSGPCGLGLLTLAPILAGLAVFRVVRGWRIGGGGMGGPGSGPRSGKPGRDRRRTKP